MSELKPCPFCGKENTVAGSTDRMILGWWYACEDCFENRKGGVHEDRWNTRPIEDALESRIAELEGKIDQLTAHSDIERQEMSVSEHANYLLNEYGRLQFDYAAYCKPDGESLRNEARNNLEEYIAKLEAEREVYQRKLEAINVILKARQSGELAQSNNAN